jgi:OOP family OmpA-OmpF porin
MIKGNCCNFSLNKKLSVNSSSAFAKHFPIFPKIVDPAISLDYFPGKIMKPKSIIPALVLALPSLAATSALAADAAASPRFYVGGGLGVSNFKTDCPSGASCSNPDVNFKLLTGYQFSPNFAIEGSYANYGSIKANYENGNATARLHTFTLAGLGIVPLSNEAQAFAKLGMHFSKGKATWDYPGADYDGSESYRKNGLLLGLGLQYDFAKNIAGRFEYERLHFGANPLSLDKTNLNVFSLSLLYKF